MGWPVALTPQAQEDLREIVIFIARRNPARARTFGDALLDKALSLGKLPERGRVVPEQDNPAVREIVFGAYRIVYQIIHDPAAVFVLRFWHGAHGEPDLPND